MPTRVETLATAPAAAYRGTFAPASAIPVEGAELPPGWEGLYFPFDTPLAELRPDGSPARDGILPEIELPRRMYAGEDTVFHSPLRFGERVEQAARAGSLVEKDGRSGRLVFADIVREYRVDGRLAIESTWHDVFLDAAPANAPARPPAPAPDEPADWNETTTLDARQLFRFSAVTLNTHRIHYDLTWARDVEGLDGLLVHGPLLRILLLDAARRHEPGRLIRSFSYRSHAPVLVDTPVELRGRATGSDTELLAVGPTGELLARALLA
jgi:3-methylfumaryl-CoA hydratase